VFNPPIENACTWELSRRRLHCIQDVVVDDRAGNVGFSNAWTRRDKSDLEHLPRLRALPKARQRSAGLPSRPVAAEHEQRTLPCAAGSIQAPSSRSARTELRVLVGRQSRRAPPWTGPSGHPVGSISGKYGAMRRRPTSRPVCAVTTGCNSGSQTRLIRAASCCRAHRGVAPGVQAFDMSPGWDRAPQPCRMMTAGRAFAWRI